MVIDKKDHKDFLLEMFQQLQFPGKFLELAHEVKSAITAAQVLEKEASKEPK